MKRSRLQSGFGAGLVRAGVVVGLVVGASAVGGPRAWGQSDVGPELGTLYLSMLPDQYQGPDLWSRPFEIVTVYLVADIDFADIGAPEQNAVNGIRAWEASITHPPQMIVTGRMLEPLTALNFGLAPDDYIIGMGTTLIAESTPRSLLRIDYVITGEIYPPGFHMEVAPLRESPQTIPGRAIWQEGLVSGRCTHRVTGSPERCFYPFETMLGLLVYTTDVPASSWGTLKGEYR